MGVTNKALVQLSGERSGRDYALAAERQARVAEAIASFGGPEAEYHAHILFCDVCAGPRKEMCGIGRRLFDVMMREERREATR